LRFHRLLTVPVQAALLVALCLGSISVLTFDVLTTRVKPEREREVADRVGKASHALAKKAVGVAVPAGITNGGLERINDQLATIANDVLRDFPDIEGGFYLGGELDRFSGYAFPTHPRPRGNPHKNDPPPLEAPYIRLQARDSLSIPDGESRSSVRDVEASRVVIVTEPVGSERPAPLATWVMYRLTDPRSLGNQVRRYQTSSGLAIAGLALAAVLLLNLGRTLRRQRQKESELRDELRRAEHLAGLGKLLAGVAHEVRNPLAAIRSTVQLWQRLPDTARSQSSMDAVVQSVDQLNQTVTQLLYFSRADHADRQPLQVNRLLQEVVDLMQAQATENKITIHCRFDDGLPEINASPNALRQVFVNLVQNAIQAMPSGGDLFVESHWDAQQRLAEIMCRDTGPGIPFEQRSHLFEPFFTTRPQGTGLGLALCREIVLQHAGQIEYFDGKPGGAVFKVVLPAGAKRT
jgi:two-component system sensor histidine kinase HydH